MIASLFPSLNFLYPACAAFGPFFLVMGIFYRTSKVYETRPKMTHLILIVGGVMIAFCLLQSAPMVFPAPN
jgi:hypothetical protein